jgi:diguanylate cyclase (GGDEF)-like protein
MWLGIDPVVLADLDPAVVASLDARRAETLEAQRTIIGLRAEARVDPLTGALNRRGIAEYLDLETEHAQRTGRSLAVLVCDLDGLKQTNEDYGLVAGDHLLCAAASVIRAELRAVDHLGRVGGDEFLAVLPSARVAQAKRIAQRIVEAVHTMTVPGVGSRRFEASVGWASTAEDDVASMSLIGVATDRLRASRQHPEQPDVIELFARPVEIHGLWVG